MDVGNLSQTLDTMLPNNLVVIEGVMVLTGGHDHHGRPIVIFPINRQSLITSGAVSKDDLVGAMQYYWGVIRLPDKCTGLAFLIDFRQSSLVVMTSIIGALNLFKTKVPEAIGNVYILRPQDMDLSINLKSQLGLKKEHAVSKLFSSRRTIPHTAEFQSILVKGFIDLARYVDMSLLTVDFGGSLSYDHTAWLLLKQTVDGFIRNMLKVKRTFPETEEQILMLINYQSKTPMGEKGSGWIERRFKEIISNSGLEDLILRADKILEEIGHPLSSHRPHKYMGLLGNPHLDNYRTIMSSLRGKLMKLMIHFQDLLLKAKNKVLLSQPLKAATKLGEDSLKWMERFGIPSIEACPKIGSSLTDAELIARDFHNELFAPGMKCISKSITIFQRMEKDEALLGSGEEPYLHELISTITKFNDSLQNRRKLYSEIYQFYLVVDKVSRWLKETLEHMPLELLDYHDQMKDTQSLPLPTMWTRRMHRYLLKHPGPRLSDICLIDKTILTIKDPDVRNQARLTSYRFKILTKMLYGDQVRVKEVKEVIEWKSRLKTNIGIGENKNDNRKNLASGPLDIKKGTFHMANELPRIGINYAFSNPKQQSNRFSRLNRCQIYEEDHRRKKLIQHAEEVVKESLENSHFLSEQDLRINWRKREEEELSLILDQLLKDIHADTRSSSVQTFRSLSALDVEEWSDQPRESCRR